MKIVYDNIIFELQEKTPSGISIYWRKLIDRLLSKTDEVLFFGRKTRNIFENQEIELKKESSLPAKIIRYLPFQRALEEGSIFHSSYYRVSIQPNIKNVVTVHDFTYEKFSSGLAKQIHIAQKHFAIRNADAIICISENTKKDLLHFYPNLDQSKIEVVYHGVSDKYSPTGEKLGKKFGNLGKYVLFVGTRSGYKNFDIALEALSGLIEYNFVFAGGGGIRKKERNLLDKKLRGRYFHFPSVSEEDLNALYNNAFCFIYPSAYEGFGMSVVEAMRAGCPVVGTNSSSIPEVAGEAGILIDKISGEKFLDAVKKLENSTFRKNLIEKGLEQSKEFSWDRCFEKTYSVYKKLAG